MKKSKFKVGELVKVVRGGPTSALVPEIDGCLGIILSHHVWQGSEDPIDRYCIVLIAGEQYDIWEYGLKKVNSKIRK